MRTPAASLTTPAATPGRLPPMTAGELAEMRREWLTRPAVARRTFTGHNTALAFCKRALKRTGSVSILPFGPAVPFEAYASDEKIPDDRGGTTTCQEWEAESLVEKAVDCGALRETRAAKLSSHRKAAKWNAAETLRARRELDAARSFVGPCDLRFLEAWKG